MDRHTAKPRIEEFHGERASEWATHCGAVAAPSTHLYDFARDYADEAEGPFCRDVDGTCSVSRATSPPRCWGTTTRS